jgi:hypothetical protein
MGELTAFAIRGLDREFHARRLGNGLPRNPVIVAQKRQVAGFR